MIFDILEIVQKTEALLLPLLPKRWRHPPPSSRWIYPLLKKLKHYRKRSEWLNVFLTSIRKRYYRAYHREGWGNQWASHEIRLIRFILIVVTFSLLTPFLGRTNVFSPWIKGGLLLGSSILFIHGAIGISISALWAVWGILFPVYASLAIGIAPWGIAFLALWALVWHTPVIRLSDSWKWVDFVCTFPILFLWVGSVGKMLPTWSLWQTALLFLMLWLVVWFFLVRAKGHPWILKTLQLFFPASLAMITLIGLARPPLFGIYRWSLWFLGTLGLSLGMAKLTSITAARSALFELKGVALIFFIYGFLVLHRAPFHPFIEGIDVVLSQLFESLEFLWWLLGAGIVLSIRGFIILLLKWVQGHLNRWVLPLLLWGLSLITYALGDSPSFLQEVGGWNVTAAWTGTAAGATLLTWRKKKTLLREWVFWGLFVFFLMYQYHKTVNFAVEQYWAQYVTGLVGFLTISIWLLWLNFSSARKLLKKFGGRISERSAVVILGALLWLMVALLWLSYVDQQFSIQGRINFHLFKGLTFLGFPLILYHLVGCEYLKLDPSKDVRWGWILLLGIGLVQILQGVEHAVAAWVGNVPFDVFQKQLRQALLNGTPLDHAAPAWVRNVSWVSFWRALRWFSVISFLPWMVRKSDQGSSEPSVLLFNACFLSVAVWTAEATWIFWAFMPLEWAVVLRPWTQSLMWDSSGLQLLATYCAASLLWGWGLSFFRSKQGSDRFPLAIPKEVSANSRENGLGRGGVGSSGEKPFQR
jgi:hypothetical protein